RHARRDNQAISGGTLQGPQVRGLVRQRRRSQGGHRAGAGDRQRRRGDAEAQKARGGGRHPIPERGAAAGGRLRLGGLSAPDHFRAFEEFFFTGGTRFVVASFFVDNSFPVGSSAVRAAAFLLRGNTCGCTARSR